MLGGGDSTTSAIDNMKKAVVNELQKLNKKQPVELQEAGP
jgi:hypothetical protein